jgi:hypothetical protein
VANETLSKEIAEQVSRAVAEGFDDPDDIIESAVEMFEEEADEEVVRPIAERLTTKAVRAHLKAQAAWPAVTDCDRLDAACTELNAAGIVTRQHFTCCSNCGHLEIGDEIKEEKANGLTVRGYAFYHMQDTESAAEGGGIYLKYGASRKGSAALVRIGQEIVAVLQRHGLKTDWNGEGTTAIQVDLDWKRRRAPDGDAIVPLVD